MDFRPNVTLPGPPPHAALLPPPLRGEALDSYSSEVWICDHFELVYLVDRWFVKVRLKWHTPNALGVGITQHSPQDRTALFGLSVVWLFMP